MKFSILISPTAYATIQVSPTRRTTLGGNQKYIALSAAVFNTRSQIDIAANTFRFKTDRNETLNFMLNSFPMICKDKIIHWAGLKIEFSEETYKLHVYWDKVKLSKMGL